jgi:hypothetical protein
MNQAIPVLTAMLAPTAMVAACGLLLLGIYNKNSNTLAIIRALNAERRKLIQNSQKPGSDLADLREIQISRENDLLRRRLRIALGQMRATVTATVLFLVTSLGLGLGQIFRWNAGGLVICLMILGITSLIVGMVLALAESGIIWRVIQAEMTLPADLGKIVGADF